MNVNKLNWMNYLTKRTQLTLSKTPTSHKTYLWDSLNDNKPYPIGIKNIYIGFNLKNIVLFVKYCFLKLKLENSTLVKKIRS